MDREELDDTLPRADRAGVFRLPAGDSAALAEAARGLDFSVFHVDLSGCVSADDVLTQFGAALRFPEWYGHTWEDLADCLTDFSWREAAGYVLVVGGLAEFRAASEDDFDTLIETLSDASASWSSMNVAFWAFLVLGD